MAVATSLFVAVVIAVLPVAWRRYTEWSRENDVGVEARRLFNTEHIFASPGSLSLSLSLQGRNAIVLQRGRSSCSARGDWKMEIDRDLGRCSRIFNLTFDVLFGVV